MSEVHFGLNFIRNILTAPVIVLGGLASTKAQKQALLDWANEHFSEFKDGTPRDKWTEPAKIAYTYFEYFEGP